MIKRTMKVKEERTGQRREGTIVQILGHGITEVVGTFEKSKNYGLVIPDNQKIQQDISGRRTKQEIQRSLRVSKRCTDTCTDIIKHQKQ